MAVKDAQDYFDLVVVSPDNVIFEDRVKRLIAPGYNQDIAILPNHTPLYAQLKTGQLTVTTLSGKVTTLAVDGGIIRVKQNRVSIIIGFDVLRH